MIEKIIKNRFYLLINKKVSTFSDETEWKPYSGIDGVVYFSSLREVKMFIKVLLSTEIYPPYELNNIRLKKLTTIETEIEI